MKERQKLVSELCMGRNKTMRMANMRESHDSDLFSSQHTCTVTFTAAPRVWHFSAFHCVCGESEHTLHKQGCICVCLFYLLEIEYGLVATRAQVFALHMVFVCSKW